MFIHYNSILMYKVLSIQDCKNMLQYYKVDKQVCIKKMKYKAVELFINRMCKCYSSDCFAVPCNNHKIQFIIHKRYYNSRNFKNVNFTQKNKY